MGILLVELEYVLAEEDNVFVEVNDLILQLGSVFVEVGNLFVQADNLPAVVEVVFAEGNRRVGSVDNPVVPLGALCMVAV